MEKTDLHTEKMEKEDHPLEKMEKEDLHTATEITMVMVDLSPETDLNLVMDTVRMPVSRKIRMKMMMREAICTEVILHALRKARLQVLWHSLIRLRQQ